MSPRSKNEIKTPRDDKIDEVERKADERVSSISDFLSSLVGGNTWGNGSAMPPSPGGLRLDKEGDWVVGEEMNLAGRRRADFKLRVVTGGIAVIIAESFKYTYMKNVGDEPVFYHFTLNERDEKPAGTGWKKFISARGVIISPDALLIHLLSDMDEKSGWRNMVTKIDNRIADRVKEGKDTLSPMIHLIPGGISILGFVEVPPQPGIPNFDPRFKIGMPPPMEP